MSIEHLHKYIMWFDVLVTPDKLECNIRRVMGDIRAT